MIFQQPEHSICTKKYSYHSWNNTGINLRSWIPLYKAKRQKFFPHKIWKLPHNTNMFFQPMSDIYTLIMGLLAHSHDLKLWNLVRFYLIGGVTLINRVPPLSKLLRYRSRSVFSLLVRLWKLTTDVWACVFICI